MHLASSFIMLEECDLSENNCLRQQSLSVEQFGHVSCFESCL